jgi:diketogulonate reductase-like aldo/keto reductase
VDIEDPVIVRIAARLGVHPAVVCIKWAVQRGQTPIPFSTKRRNYLANLQGVVGEPLTDAEMAGHRRHRPRLPADQGAGVPVEGRAGLAGSVG